MGGEILAPRDALDLPKYHLMDMFYEWYSPYGKIMLYYNYLSNCTAQNSDLYYCIWNGCESFRCEVCYSLKSSTAQYCGLHSRCWSLTGMARPACLFTAALWEGLKHHLVSKLLQYHIPVRHTLDRECFAVTDCTLCCMSNCCTTSDTVDVLSGHT